MTYEIHVNFASPISTKEVVNVMQAVYDNNGVAGMFVIDGHVPGIRTIRFQRDAVDDGAHINRRIPYGPEITDKDLSKAAGEQLLAELTIYTPDKYFEEGLVPNNYSMEGLMPIFGKLQDGKFTLVGAQELNQAVMEARKAVPEDFLASNSISQMAP